MNRLEMAQKLFENPKLKARIIESDYEVKVIIDSNESRHLSYYQYGGRKHLILQMILVKGETWEIIEPKLKEFCFGEIYHMMYYNNTKISITSISSGRDYGGLNTEFSIEELKGKWTIEGYYE